MKFVIDERLIRDVIESGKITAEDLGLRWYQVCIPAMPDMPYSRNEGYDDQYFRLPDTEHRVYVTEVLGRPGAPTRTGKNGRTVRVIRGSRSVRTYFINYCDALDVCYARERKYHRGEHRMLDKWLASRAAFNHGRKGVRNDNRHQ